MAEDGSRYEVDLKDEVGVWRSFMDQHCCLGEMGLCMLTYLAAPNVI